VFADRENLIGDQAVMQHNIRRLQPADCSQRQQLRISRPRANETDLTGFRGSFAHRIYGGEWSSNPSAESRAPNNSHPYLYNVYRFSQEYIPD
jgi:hypothetical protein